MTHVNFVATFGTVLEAEIDKPIDDIDADDLEASTIEQLDEMDEDELRDLYRENPVNTEDPIYNE